MNRKIKLLFLLILAVVFVTCKKEEKYEYPLIQTGDVTDITSSGATFHAKIFGVGSTEILEYGFVWGLVKMPVIISSNVIIVKKNETVVISCRITNDLFAEKDYNVRAFARNAKYTTYGLPIKFSSKGSLPPTITDFEPKSGTSGTKVTIYGDNFSNNINHNKIHIGKFVAVIDSVSKNKLIISLPQYIKTSGFAKIVVESSGKLCSSTESFRLTGVVINNFYPKKVFVGDTLYIECEDLSPILNENEVKIGNKKLEFINISGNTISALIANNEYPKVNNVTITVKGKTNEALDSLTILKTWSSVISYNSILSRDGSTGFTINGISYIFSFMYLSGNINEFWSFDIEKNSWKKCTNFPGGPRNYAVAFSIGSKGYVGMGDYSGFFTDFYEYNPETNIWTLKNFFPGQVRYNYFSLVIGNKSYVGFGESYDHIYNKDFWAYNPETDAWKRLSDFPGVNYETVFGFQYKNEGYISVGNHSAYKELWKYNAQEDKWVFLSIVPTQMDFAFSFILNDFGYFITKESYSIPTSWRYNIKNNTWTRIEDFKFYQGSKTIIFESNNNIYISPNSGTLIKFNAKW